MEKELQLSLIFKIASQIYDKILREMLLNAIDDPNSVFDDFVIDVFDRLFNYKGD